eukprot:snap_masked-scaffold_72-processed-gene-0.24-mRNA-1 protein AED:1.00 eAED:1.00 QI:0/0/0/0/1/1/2/0/64
MLQKYIFQIMSLNHASLEVELFENEANFRSDVKSEEKKIIRYLSIADTPVTVVEVALHREFSRY